jgi:hypothetical protein
MFSGNSNGIDTGGSHTPSRHCKASSRVWHFYCREIRVDFVLAALAGRSAHLPVVDAIAQRHPWFERWRLPFGPNLTSKKWLWSDGSYAGILKTIKDGVPNPKEYRSPMPPLCGAQLTSEQLAAVSAYVWALSH